MDINKKERIINLILHLLIVGLMVMAAVKILFVGYDMDEQYAYAVAYRLLKGDILLKEMWEPHQSSAFVQALIMAGYLKLFGATGVVLFSRFIGMLIHVSLMVLTYFVLRTKASSLVSLGTVAMVFFTIPKLMFTADFSNLLMWNMLILMLALYKYYSGEKRQKVFMVLAGMGLTIAVLSYPSAIVLVIVCAALVISLRIDKNNFIKETLALSGPCIAGLCAFMALLIGRTGISEIREGLGHVLNDGSHSVNTLQRLTDNLKSLTTVVIFILIYAIVTFLISLIIRKKCKINPERFISILMVVCLVGQLFIWIFGNKYINYPRVEMFVASTYLIVKGIRQIRNQDARRDFFIFTVIPVAGFLGVCIFTNHPFLASAPFLAYVLIGFVLQTEVRLETKTGMKTVLLIICAMIILSGNIYLIRTADGIRCTIFDEVSMIRKGPATGIVADDRIVTRNKDDYELMKTYIPEESKVLYMGRDSDVYMSGNYEVCAPSTISTPTYNEETLEYYAINPHKNPEYVVFENSYINNAETLFGDEYEEIASNYFIHIMKKK